MRMQINKRGLEYPGTEYALKQPWRGEYYLFDQDRESEAIIAYYCPVCGTEFFGLWKIGWPMHTYTSFIDSLPTNELSKMNEYYNLIKEELRTFIELKNCPICNGILSHEDGFAKSHIILPSYFSTKEEDNYWRKSLPNFLGSSLNDAYESMASWRMLEDRMAGVRAKDNLCLDFDKPSNKQYSFATITSIKDSPYELQKFLQELIDIENAIYGLKKRLSELYFKRIENDRVVKANAYIKKFVKYQIEHEAVNEFYEIELKIEEYTALIAQIRRSGRAKIEKPESPALQTPAWYNKRKIEAKNKKALEEYNHVFEKYTAEMKRLADEYQNKLQEAHTKLEYYEAQRNQLQNSIPTRIEKETEIQENTICPEKTIKVILDSEINTAETILKKLFECRNEMYGMNIVYEKYHNIVALCSFYEYLMAGRCQSLEGTFGAYNLYEEELRSKLIMDKLDNITSALEKINNNQQMIYSKLTKIHESLDTMQNTMNTAVNTIQKMAVNQTQTNKYLAQIAENTDYIAYSTAINAYYSKVNAQLTKSLGYLIALK